MSEIYKSADRETNEKKCNTCHDLEFLKNEVEINNSLTKWIYIESESDFIKRKKILKSKNIFDLTGVTYNSIIPSNSTRTWWMNPRWFVLKKDIWANVISVYINNQTLFLDKKLNLSKWWEINNWGIYVSWWYFEKHQQWEGNESTKLKMSDNIKKYHTDFQLPQVMKETPKKTKDSTPEKVINKNQDEEYTIKKWDKLWNIVKEHYWLEDPRDIANAVNRVAKYNAEKWKTKTFSEDFNPPDGIIWDKIIIWKNIYLPDTLMVLKKEFKKVQNKEIIK